MSLDPVGAILGTPPPDYRDSEHLRLHRGPDMLELIAIVVGFLLISACVIAVARGSTARWERDRRAARAARRAAVAPPDPARGPGTRLRRALASAAATVGRAPTPIRVPLQAAGRIVATSRRQVGHRLSAAPKMWGALRSAVQRGRTADASSATPARDPSVQDGEACAAAPGAPERSGEARIARSGRRAGVPSHDVGRAIPRLTRRLATRLVHRHSRSEDSPVAGTGSEKDGTAP